MLEYKKINAIAERMQTIAKIARKEGDENLADFIETFIEYEILKLNDCSKTTNSKA